MKHNKFFIFVACSVVFFIGWEIQEKLIQRIQYPLVRVRDLCMNVKPGVSIDQLTQLFGPPKHIKDSEERYLFGSDEYSVMYSDYIVAQVNQKGEVVEFRCGEGMYPWRKK